MSNIAVLFARADSYYKTLPGCATYGISSAMPVSGRAVALSSRIRLVERGAGCVNLQSRVQTKKDLRCSLLPTYASLAECLSILPKVRYGLKCACLARANFQTSLEAGRWKSSNSIGVIARKRRHGFTSLDARRLIFRRFHSAKDGQRIAFVQPRAIQGCHLLPKPSASIRPPRLAEWLVEVARRCDQHTKNKGA